MDLTPLVLESPAKNRPARPRRPGDLPTPSIGGRHPSRPARTPTSIASRPRRRSAGSSRRPRHHARERSGPPRSLRLRPGRDHRGPRPSSRRSGPASALEPGDVAARANFCTVDGTGLVTDRRAGRIPSEMCAGWSRSSPPTPRRFEDVRILLEAGKGSPVRRVLRGPRSRRRGERRRPAPRGEAHPGRLAARARHRSREDGADRERRSSPGRGRCSRRAPRQRRARPRALRAPAAREPTASGSSSGPSPSRPIHVRGWRSSPA